MNLSKEDYQFNNNVILHTPSQSAITLYAISFLLAHQDGKLKEIYINFSVNLELFTYIKVESLFNFKPETQINEKIFNFNAFNEIYIKVSLHPRFIAQLAESVNDIDQVVSYFTSLNKSQPDHSIFLTENWFALEFKQIQQDKEVNYQTFWSYISPSILVQDNISQSEISTAIGKYFQEWIDKNLPQMAQEATEETFADISDSLEELADVEFKAIAEETTTQLVGALANAFQEWADTTANGNYRNSTSTQSIFDRIVNFFQEDEWPFQQVEGESALRLAFEGENGQWNCYAKAKETEQQFVFYSLCPFNAPEEKKQAIAEFITRANYGMLIGNFELDFSDGEIRYKTSIDVEGDRLTFALIKRLVYANIAMMDEYLPGIEAIIENDVLPVDAIAEIES